MLLVKMEYPKRGQSYILKSKIFQIILKSGNLVVTEELNSLNGISYSEPLGPNEVADLEGTIFKDYDGYTASIKNIYCYDKVSIK